MIATEKERPSGNAEIMRHCPPAHGEGTARSLTTLVLPWTSSYGWGEMELDRKQEASKMGVGGVGGGSGVGGSGGKEEGCCHGEFSRS